VAGSELSANRIINVSFSVPNKKHGRSDGFMVVIQSRPK
jgi:hypothetical protein